MATWTRWILAVGLALLAAGCSTAARGPAVRPKTASVQASFPAMTVTPDTGLTGGQPLRVRMTGFPPHSTIELYECAAMGACDGAAASYAGTASTGTASVTFIAQPSVVTGSGTARCAGQCVLAAVIIKKPGGASPASVPAATVRLSFATGSPGAADLAYSSLLGTSWISAADGWALAVQPCATGTCTWIARTIDGGRHWQVLSDLAAATGDGTAGCPPTACVSQVSFASPAIGYLYGPALQMTTDGGRTWQAQPGPATETLAIDDGQVYRVAYAHAGCPGPCQPSLQEAPAGSASWRTLISRLAEPDRSNSAQIVASGPDVLLAMYGGIAGPLPGAAVIYRSADGGGTWRQMADPCSRPGSIPPSRQDDLRGLAAAAGGFFAGLCATPGSTSTVVVSADAGLTWQPTAAPPAGQWLGQIAAATPSTIAVATGATGGNGTYTARLLETTDGGQQWVTAATDTQNLSAGGVPAWLGFQTPLAGQWLGDAHGTWTTTDGGLHWTRTAFG